MPAEQLFLLSLAVLAVFAPAAAIAGIVWAGEQAILWWRNKR